MSLDVIEIHDLFLHFCPIPWAPEGGVDTAPKARGCILEGPKGCQGGNRKQKTRSCRRGIIPEPCQGRGAAEMGNKIERSKTAEELVTSTAGN